MRECGQVKLRKTHLPYLLNYVIDQRSPYSFTPMIRMHIHLGQKRTIVDNLQKCVANRGSVRSEGGK